MVHLIRNPRFSGMVHPDDIYHAVQVDKAKIVAPHYVEVPGGKLIPQYAPTVMGTSLEYDPSKNCYGNFMSYKFQANNNCYNYSCNVATNSFAQPGRKHGFFIEGAPTGEQVVKGARMDGIVLVGKADMTLDHLRKEAANFTAGHFVVLLISEADASVRWSGDYHWVRCDDNKTYASWSQKDGGDQVTNFDFAGNLIVDPSASNWTVNQGPLIQNNPDDIVISYQFYAYMYVPFGKIDII